ncbi:MAG: hypothetical protein K6F76_07795 [Clostridiales bacterium]|nr:hypothetical protein [Clostridiales bacterium]
MKLPPLSELQKLAAEKGVELPDDILDEVAGGAYTEEEWKNMTVDERRAAQQRSLIARLITHEPCELD